MVDQCVVAVSAIMFRIIASFFRSRNHDLSFDYQETVVHDRGLCMSHIVNGTVTSNDKGCIFTDLNCVSWCFRIIFKSSTIAKLYNDILSSRNYNVFCNVIGNVDN